MTEGEFGNSGAPLAGTVSEEERTGTSLTPEEQAASKQLNKEQIAVDAPEGIVAYVASDEFANSRFLVKAGEATKAAPVPGSASSVLPLINRVGDVWAIFTAGILTTDNPLVIAWCEDHPERCRRSDDPMTKPWATLKALSTNRANRERSIPSEEMDADAAFPPHVLDNTLAAQAAKDGSAGAKQVQNAEISRQSAEATRSA